MAELSLGALASGGSRFERGGKLGNAEAGREGPGGMLSARNLTAQITDFDLPNFFGVLMGAAVLLALLVGCLWVAQELGQTRPVKAIMSGVADLAGPKKLPVGSNPEIPGDGTTNGRGTEGDNPPGAQQDDRFPNRPSNPQGDQIPIDASTADQGSSFGSDAYGGEQQPQTQPPVQPVIQPEAPRFRGGDFYESGVEWRGKLNSGVVVRLLITSIDSEGNVKGELEMPNVKPDGKHSLRERVTGTASLSTMVQEEPVLTVSGSTLSFTGGLVYDATNGARIHGTFNVETEGSLYKNQKLGLWRIYSQ